MESDNKDACVQKEVVVRRLRRLVCDHVWRPASSMVKMEWTILEVLIWVLLMQVLSNTSPKKGSLCTNNHS